MRNSLIVAFLAFFAFGNAQLSKKQLKQAQKTVKKRVKSSTKYNKSIANYMNKDTYKDLPEGLYAFMDTSKGDMLIQFYEKETPMTVANFVGLAEGSKENKATNLGTPYYDGLIFHRVIKKFMLQAGDPDGTGSGGPGYKFDNEIVDSLKHSKKGILSMANSGPNTNGSQFFITEVPTPWLDGKYSVFGEVIEGLDIIDSISNVEKGAKDKPKKDVVINKIEILRKGDAYKKYDANIAFEAGNKANKIRIAEAEKRKAEAKAAKVAKIKALTAKSQTTASGLRYVVLEQGDGAKPVDGDNIKVHYALSLEDGEAIDSSFKRNKPLDIVVGKTSLIKGWLESLTMFERGSKVFLIVPPELGYGAKGAGGGTIPSNATLYFNMEFLK